MIIIWTWPQFYWGFYRADFGWQMNIGPLIIERIKPK